MKGVIVKAGVTPEHTHDLTKLVNEVAKTDLVPRADVKLLETSVNVITMSGTYTNFKYPEKDPPFFASQPKPEVIKRVTNADNVYNICSRVVSGS